MANKKPELTKKESNEALDVTIGRVRSIANSTHNERLLNLINKISDDVFDLNSKLIEVAQL